MRPICALLLGAVAATAAEPVLTLDYQGGYTAPRQTPAPYVRLFADGRVEVPDRGGKGAGWTMRLEPAETAALVALGRKVLDFDQARVEKQLAAAMGAVRQMIEDAADVVVTVAVDGKRHVARFNALDYWAKRYPKIDELQRLQAVASRLDLLMHVARAGGRDVAARALALANRELRKKAPQARPLVAADLRNVGIATDGRKTLSYYRSEPGGQTAVRVRIGKDGKLAATVKSTG